MFKLHMVQMSVNLLSSSIMYLALCAYLFLYEKIKAFADARTYAGDKI